MVCGIPDHGRGLEVIDLYRSPQTQPFCDWVQTHSSSLRDEISPQFLDFLKRYLCFCTDFLTSDTSADNYSVYTPCYICSYFHTGICHKPSVSINSCIFHTCENTTRGSPRAVTSIRVHSDVFTLCPMGNETAAHIQNLFHPAPQ